MASLLYQGMQKLKVAAEERKDSNVAKQLDFNV